MLVCSQNEVNGFRGFFFDDVVAGESGKGSIELLLDLVRDKRPYVRLLAAEW